MPALNFQKRFAPLVESGEKRQTIRKYRKDGRDAKPGDTLFLYTGMRTKACRLIATVRCEATFPMRLTRERPTDLTPTELLLDDEFAAKLDGFESHAEMLDWFEKTHGLPFTGLLIRW